MSKRPLVRVAKIKISTIVIILAIFAFITPVWMVGGLNFDELGWVFGLYWDAAGETPTPTMILIPETGRTTD